MQQKPSSTALETGKVVVMPGTHRQVASNQQQPRLHDKSSFMFSFLLGQGQECGVQQNGQAGQGQQGSETAAHMHPGSSTAHGMRVGSAP